MNPIPPSWAARDPSCVSSTLTLISPEEASMLAREIPSAESAETLEEVLLPGRDSSTTVTVDVEAEKGTPSVCATRSTAARAADGSAAVARCMRVPTTLSAASNSASRAPSSLGLCSAAEDFCAAALEITPIGAAVLGAAAEPPRPATAISSCTPRSAFDGQEITPRKLSSVNGIGTPIGRPPAVTGSMPSSCSVRWMSLRSTR